MDLYQQWGSLRSVYGSTYGKSRWLDTNVPTPVKNHHLLQEDQNNGFRNNYIRFAVITMLTRGVFPEAQRVRLSNEVHCGNLMLMSMSVPDASPDLTFLLVLAGMARQTQQAQNHSKHVVVILHSDKL